MPANKSKRGMLDKNPRRSTFLIVFDIEPDLTEILGKIVVISFLNFRIC